MSGYYLLRKGEFAYNKSTSGDSPWGAVKRLVRYEKGCVSTLYICFGLNDADPDFLVTYYETDRWYKAVQMIAAEGARNHGLLNIAPDDFFDTALILPPSREEQELIGLFFARLDNLITLHQRKCQCRSLCGYFSWEQRKLGDELKRIQERNREGLGDDRWISVSRMYFQNPDKVQSNNLDTRTYVMRHGDMAFEGHKNSEHEYGRLVVNDIGDGIISELFPIYRHKCDFDNQFWKYAAMLETIWRPIFARSIAASGNSSNKLIDDHMFSESVFVPCVEEQRAIGTLLHQIDRTITLHQRKESLASCAQNRET